MGAEKAAEANALTQYDDGITPYGTKDNSDGKKKKKAEDEGPTIPYYRLYRYATCFDGILLFIGILAACINGAGIPMLLIFLGDIIDSFTTYGRYDQCDFDYDTCLAAGLTNLSEKAFNEHVLTVTDNFRETAVQTVMYMVYIGCATFVCSALQVACFSLSSVRQTRQVRIQYFRAILRQDIGFHDQTTSGELNVRLSSDINKIAEGTGEKVATLLQYISMSVSGLTIGFLYSWKMSLVTLCVAPLIAVASTIFFLIITMYTKKELIAYAQAGWIAEEAITCIRTVTSLGCQSKFNDRYSVNLIWAKKMGMERGTLTGMSTGSLYFCIYGAYGLVFWYGTTLVLSGEIDVGDMMTTFFAILIGAFALGTAGAYFGAISEAKAAATKIFQVIDRVPTIDVFSTQGEEPGEKGSIELRDVEFAYPSRPDAQVLKKVSLKVEHGQTVALVGHSGCGKSTIIQLVQRFYDVSGGEIKIGEKKIQDICIAKLRKTIGVVAQEPVLFATTIAENIRWGKDDATDEEIKDAAKLANAYNFITGMPEQFDTHVGEGGGQMSGGQKQRIAIARAILRNPKILLLDEATSSLDTESESIVQSALDKASKGRTTIVVAHRLSTVRNADNIIAFDGGKVVESGTHEELQALGGIYAKLCSTQQFINELGDDGETEPQKEDGVDVNSVKTITKSKVKSTSLDEVDEKAKQEDETVSVKRLLQLNKPEWPYMGIGAFFAALAGSADPVSAIIFADFLTVFTHPDEEVQKQRSVDYAFAFAGIGVTAFFACSLEAALFSKAGMELTTRLRKKAFASILRQDISYFDDPANNTGVLCSRLSSDASKVQGCTGGKLGLVMKNFSSLGVALGIAFAYSWKLTLLMMAFIPFIIIGCMVEMKVIMGDEEKVKKEYAQSTQMASEAITNVRTIASLARETTALENYTKVLDIPIQKKKKQSLYMGIAYGYSQCIVCFTYAAVFRWGIELVISRDTSFENVFKVITVVLFGAMAVAQNSSFAPDFAEAQTAAYRILQLIDLVPSIDSYSDEGYKPVHCSGSIEISSVFFRYPTRQQVTVLNGLTISVKPGQTLALVGQSGCGKSTTIQLLERFYDANEGEVMMDGTDVKKLNVSWLRQQIGLVSQEPTLFDLSIKENIRYGDCTRNTSKDEVIKAASDANAHNFISGLPEVYETPAGAKGGQLSGGQKQRIAIARALIRNPKILLLDEATSALDTESERIVQEAIDAARSGRTCIVIAHRLSTIKNADQIAVVDRGAVIECGSHDELVAAKGAYYKLVNV